MKASPRSARTADEFGNSHVAEPAVVIETRAASKAVQDEADPDKERAVAKIREGLKYDREHPGYLTGKQVFGRARAYLAELKKVRRNA